MLSPGLRIGEHVVVRLAGMGAMSEVYEGRHATLGHPVAIKVLFSEWCQHAEVMARFLNEAHALQSVRHAHVVTAFDCGALPSGPPYMVLEWLPVDLHQVLSRAGGALPPGAAFHVAAQLADALAALHEQGIIHRDLKPANVLLAREELSALEVKLADFGLAKVLPTGALGRGELGPTTAHPVSTGGSALLGTWDYMAPEQWFDSKGAGPKADVYALGVLLFQMLTGRLPFVAEQEMHLMQFHLFESPPLELLDGRAPTAARELVAGMMNKNHEKRPTMREVMERLARLA